MADLKTFSETISPDLFREIVLKLNLNQILLVCNKLSHYTRTKICNSHFYRAIAKKYNLELASLDPKEAIRNYAKFVYIYSKAQSDYIYAIEYYLYEQYETLRRERILNKMDNFDLSEFVDTGDLGYMVEIESVWYSLKNDTFFVLSLIRENESQIARLMPQYTLSERLREIKINSKKEITVISDEPVNISSSAIEKGLQHKYKYGTPLKFLSKAITNLFRWDEDQLLDLIKDR